MNKDFLNSTAALALPDARLPSVEDMEGIERWRQWRRHIFPFRFETPNPDWFTKFVENSNENQD
jgi:hypothetical protein